MTIPEAVQDRDFTNFYMGDNVYQLAGGVVPELADRLDVSLASEPNSADLQRLVKTLGEGKVLRENPELTDTDREAKAALLDRAGTQKALNRSLHTPEITVAEDTVDAFLFMTCVANWQNRAEAIAPVALKNKAVHSLGGNRVMKSPTETVNPSVQRLFECFGKYPTEAQYAGAIIVPRLAVKGFSVMPHSYPTGVGNELLSAWFSDNPELLEQRIVVVKNANAGVITSVQVRDAARKIDQEFDTDPSSPQVLMLTDEAAPARTDEQEAQSLRYQKVDPGLRQLGVTALKLHLASGGE